MKRILVVLTLAAFATAAFAAEAKLGKPLKVKQPTPISKLLENPAKYVGKTVQVKGNISGVCQMMGCWMTIQEPGTDKAVKIKVKDGDIVFPKDSAGKTAIAEGKFMKVDAAKEEATQAAHQGEAAKQTGAMDHSAQQAAAAKQPAAMDHSAHQAAEKPAKTTAAKAKAEAPTYQIEGTGAVIID